MVSLKHLQERVLVYFGIRPPLIAKLASVPHLRPNHRLLYQRHIFFVAHVSWASAHMEGGSMNLRANPTPAQARGQREKNESVKQSQVRAPNYHIFRICSNSVWHASL